MLGRTFRDRDAGTDGKESPLEGVILDVVPNEHIVFIGAFTVGWIPHTIVASPICWRLWRRPI